MLEAPHFSSAGAKRKGAFALPADVFDGRVNRPVMHQAVRAYLNNQRQGTAKTKTRSEVSGGNQKPWRQKGTGRARQGTIRAPHWRGGGTVFGPQPRDYTTELPRKVRQLARRSALNARAQDELLYVVEGFAFEAPKTKELAALLAKLELAGRKVLVLTHGVRETVHLSGRNLPAVRVLPYADASAYDILWSEAVVVEEGALTGAPMPEPAPARPAAKPKAAKAAKAAKPKATKAAKPKAKAAPKKKGSK